MFARVIPVLRTPIGVDGFDYRIPEGMHVRVGVLVRVPFRRGITVGVVDALLPTSPFAAKAAAILGSYAGLSLNPACLTLLHDTAERTFCSAPTILKSWLRDLPKRPSEFVVATPRAHTVGQVEARWSVDPEAALLEAARTRTGRVLILAPWLARIDALRAELPDAMVLTSRENAGDAFRAWVSFLTSEHAVLLTTRLGAWLAPHADAVLLDEPENDDYKQDEQAPRYDARRLAIGAHQRAGTSVIAFGLTPPLHREEPAPEITLEPVLHVRHPGARSKIPMLQADTVNTVIAHEGPRIIIHPIKGLAARVVCRDCRWRATCPECAFGVSQDQDGVRCRRCGYTGESPLTCPSCGGYDLGKALPGIERLKAAWTRAEPDTQVEWRDLSNEAMDAAIPTGALVVVTDASLLGGAAEDVRREERRCIAYRRLAARVAEAHGTLLLQTHEEDMTRWSSWLTPEGFATFRTQERAERRVFRYPPSTRVVKAILPVSEREAILWLAAVKASCLKHGIPPLETRGPLPATFQLRTRTFRWIVHLVFDPNTHESTLITTLTPHSKTAILDLDPIAFLR